MQKISVVIPVYNVEKYLSRCVNSILAQTFTDFELILVDDGSSDNSLSICNEFAQRDSRIKVFHQENRGASSARNFGAKQSLGDYIIFVDSDDFVAEEYLERLYKACVDNDADISLISFEGGCTEENSVPEYQEKVLVLTNREAINEYGKKCGPNYRSAVSKLVKREIILNNPFPQDRIWSEDTACVYKWYWEANKVVEIFGSMYFYYCTPKSVSNTKFDERHLQELDTFEEMLSFYRKNNFDMLEQSYVWRHLNTSINYYNKAISENNKDLANRFINRSRIIIKKYKKKYQITMRNRTDLYDIVYPVRAHIYRILRRIFAKEKGSL